MLVLVIVYGLLQWYSWINCFIYLKGSAGKPAVCINLKPDLIFFKTKVYKICKEFSMEDQSIICHFAKDIYKCRVYLNFQNYKIYFFLWRNVPDLHTFWPSMIGWLAHIFFLGVIVLARHKWIKIILKSLAPTDHLWNGYKSEPVILIWFICI